MWSIIYRDMVSPMRDNGEWLLDSTYRFKWHAQLRLRYGLMPGRSTLVDCAREARVVRTNTLRVYEPVLKTNASGSR